MARKVKPKAEAKPATTEPNIDSAVDHLVEALEALGYKVITWRDGEDEEKRRERLEERTDEILALFPSEQLLGNLKERDDWNIVDVMSEELTDDDVEGICVEKGIKLAADDELRPIALAAVRVAHAPMTRLYDELHRLQMELKDKGIHNATVGEMILR